MEKQIINRYYSIDLFKLIFAFVVVSIHTNPLVNINGHWYNTVYNVVVGMAVPFFFIASGFFIGKKAECIEHVFWFDPAAMRKYFLKILKMYVIWMVVYTPIVIVHYAQSGFSVWKSVSAYLIGFLFVGEHYNNWVLWYLLSAIYTVAVIRLFMKKGLKERDLVILVILASVLMEIFSYIGNYPRELTGIAGMIKKAVSHAFTSGRIFTGFVYIPIGIILSKWKVPIPISFALLVIGISGGLLIDQSIVSRYFLLISSIGLFDMVKSIKLPDSEAYSVIRRMSTVIFLIHLLIWTAYYMLAYGTKTYGVDSFVVVSLVSALIALTVSLYEKKSNKTGKHCQT